MPSRHPPPPTGAEVAGPRPFPRRTLLRGGALAGVVGVLAGCGLFADGLPERPGAGALDGTDTGDLTEALRAEEALLQAYRASADRHPGLRDRLDALRGDHEEHRRVLLALLADLDPSGAWAAASQAPGAAGPAPAPAATDPAPAPASPSPGGSPPVPDRREDALAALRALEQDAASARTEQAVRAGARWAPLFGVLAASETSHAAVLAA